MIRVIISGFYGSGNVGDEAILEAIILKLKEKYTNIEITVISKNQSSTKRDHDVKTLGRNDFKGFFKKLYRCDVLISGGGSLLQDATSTKSLIYYLAVILSAKIFGKKVMLYSHGIGPINNKFFRILTGRVLNLTDVITVREENSKKDLIRMGVKKDIYVTADPVVSYDVKGKVKNIDTYRFDNGKKTIGMSLKSKILIESQEKISQLRIFFEKILIDYNIVILPFYYDQDIQIINKLIELGMLEHENIKYIDYKINYKEVFNIMNNLDLFVGERLHSLIFSSVLNIPFVGISYDPKIDYFLEDIGLNAVFNVEDFDSERLLKQIEHIFNNEIAFKKDLSYNVQRLRNKLFVCDKLFEELIRNFFNEE